MANKVYYITPESRKRIRAFKYWQRQLLHIVLVLVLLILGLGGFLQVYKVTNTTCNSRNVAQCSMACTICSAQPK